MTRTAVGPGAFERLSPSRFAAFSFPNPRPDPYGDPLRIAVLDSPIATHPPKIAAILVPLGREADWTFSTDSGHLHLLLASLPLSRLILVGNFPSSSAADSPPIPANADPESLQRFQQLLVPLLLALSPKAAFRDGIPAIPFLSYEDDVVRSVSLEIISAPVAGEILVEDVEIAGDPTPERRRRLRFRRTPNLVQSQVRLLPDPLDLTIWRPELGSLSQPYLAPMAASLSLVAPHIEGKFRSSSRPRALCVGVGGGALLMFLNLNLGFDVTGVEADDAVLSVARRHFGLTESESLRVVIGDGIEFIERFAVHSGAAGFDVVMVDLDSVDSTSAPPLNFVTKRVLAAARGVLNETGLLVVNVIVPEASFLDSLVDAFRQVFSQLYELDVGNGENYVLIAAKSAIESVASVRGGGSFNNKLREAVGERYMDRIRII